jgi:hypothetical protein
MGGEEKHTSLSDNTKEAHTNNDYIYLPDVSFNYSRRFNQIVF